MLAVGIVVRVLPPFDAEYPGEYMVEARSATGAWQIAGGVDFAPEYLEAI